MHIVSANDAVAAVNSGDRVFVQTAAATPTILTAALAERGSELRGVEVIHLHTEGSAPYASADLAESFHTNALFVGANVRDAVDAGRADFIPIFLSEVPALFRRRVLPLDVALVHVSPPDRHGFCSLGVSVDATRAAVLAAKTVIAQINPHMPRTHGDGLIHTDKISLAVEVNQSLPEFPARPLTNAEVALGRNCAELIEDGATLQTGIGAIPDAVLSALSGHRDLGLHTEMFSDGVVDLIESGVITNARKRVHPGRVVSSFVMGTQRLYDFVDDNPQVVLLDCGYVNDTAVIRRNPKVTAINGAIEVDLTGQVVADSIGTRIFSGVGGQMDFIRGASLSEGGKPIIALLATTRRDESRIVPLLKPGAGVVTTRAHVHFIVTEFGVADLYGKNLRQRARALIDVAHPDQRDNLEQAAFERFKGPV